MSMLANIAKRLLQTVLILVCVAALIFFMLRIVPGNTIQTMMGDHADAEKIERMTRELGLDRSAAEQFFIYITGLFSGDMGTSYKFNRPVSELIALAFPNTVKLALMAAAFAWVLGLICGIVSAVRKNSILDRLFMGASLLGVSVPVFMVAMLLQYVFAFKLKIFGISSSAGRFVDYILPAIALGWNSAGSIARLTRSTLTEVLMEDYIDTACAKGMRRARVITGHALRNAVLPVITMMAVQLSSLLSGAVICETIFSINGIGRLACDAISGRDVPLLQGTILFSTAIVVLGNFVADSLYSVLDPRIRKGV